MLDVLTVAAGALDPATMCRTAMFNSRYLSSGERRYSAAAGMRLTVSIHSSHLQAPTFMCDRRLS
ncbi:hypothetical protein FB388_4272 [Pseudonocardia cypriaca]|uniref:Uncharacterized protein n=1 Tax=Pseudonocardia cypriaca TaxID=882449 RepID=A0A543FTB5_9PSEU|nr:hypothetical protein FB388_4272 [Pseudonocardia cypriaca]